LRRSKNELWPNLSLQPRPSGLLFSCWSVEIKLAVTHAGQGIRRTSSRVFLSEIADGQLGVAEQGLRHRIGRHEQPAQDFWQRLGREECGEGRQGEGSEFSFTLKLEKVKEAVGVAAKEICEQPVETMFLDRGVNERGERKVTRGEEREGGRRRGKEGGINEVMSFETDVFGALRGSITLYA